MTRLRGSITALVTPFRNGEIDEDAYRALIERQIENGTHGLVPCGSTGESPTVTHAEHKRLIEICVSQAKGRCPVVAGAGSNATHEALELARFAEEAGADALLCATGYYNKPSQAGLYGHFRALHDAVSLPIVIYNVPGRTVVNVSVQTIGELSKLPRIIGVKDATGDLARVALQRGASGAAFVQLSGEDMTAVGFNAMGGVGCISVTSNVAPAMCAEMQEATLEGDYPRAVALQDRLWPLHDALFADTNPAPAKYALSLLGLCTAEVRLPMAECSAPAKAKVEAALSALDLV